MVEKAQIFFFSLLTSSTVQVVRMASVQDIAILEIMAVSISKATRALKGTAKKPKNVLNTSRIRKLSYLLSCGTSQAV